MPSETVILVDNEDRPVGTAEKIFAHQNNALHRAFSIFIFRETEPSSILLQQRALGKYHCGGLWTNTCCSHPRPGESILEAGTRRLQEEFGFQVPLRNLGWFHYNAHFDNGLSENEIDHVLVGTLGDESLISPNAEEIHAYRWVSIEDLETELAEHPEKFTPWLKGALEVVSASK